MLCGGFKGARPQLEHHVADRAYHQAATGPVQAPGGERDHDQDPAYDGDSLRGGLTLSRSTRRLTTTGRDAPMAPMAKTSSVTQMKRVVCGLK